jgi:UDP-N-acetyl-D-galactosamine dehydrogenase
VFLHDPHGDADEAHEEYGITLSPWEALPRAGAVVAAGAHAEYRWLHVDQMAAKLASGNCFVDVKSAFDREALLAASVRLRPL